MKMKTVVQNLWDRVKVVLRGKFIVILANKKKISRKQSNLMPKEARKRTKPNINRIGNSKD